MTHTIDQLVAPKSLNDFGFSRARDKTLLELILDGRLQFPLAGKVGFCFWGGYGTGKTTLAKLLPQLLEASGALPPVRKDAPFDARGQLFSFNRCGVSADGADTLIGIEVRSKEMSTQPSDSGWNYEILDEVDLMHGKTQSALKTIMTASTATIFLLTTNHLDKVDAGIKDRCHLIEMNAPSRDQIIVQSCRVLRHLGLTEEQILSSDVNLIADRCHGSWRELTTALYLEYQSIMLRKAA
jgi:DNA polymerase III delta prime subunit